ncbi:hypothetical protein PR003_g21437 [Phytophthora rubi]|nr:hypothetical protein PR002_g20929 [Phytophthora rubi]KAE9305657.1 hypothetical protein PR003_g21437 [Phytophthora rubi]
MVRQFFQRRSDQEKRKYLVAARRVCQISLMRWMIENGAPLDVTTAINICWTGRFYGMKQDYPTYVEVAWWLKESDRVSLVAEGLSYKNHHHMLLLWVLENTFFQHASSRSAIRRAIKTAPTDTIQWLSENLLAPAIRAWCFEDEH